MQLDRPRFRQDLVAEPIDDAGNRFIDVMDPDSGNVFRFFEVEYSLACAMDGERDVPGIVQWAKDELGLVPSPAEVKTVIATLGELGYLDKAPGTHAPAPADDLHRGVVVGQKRMHTPAPDLELGNAGATAAAPPPKATPVSNIELSPGVTAAKPSSVKHAPADDIALGTPGRTDVSTDLADSVGIGVEDVKAAVRASQVMKAVDVPPELAAALEEPKPATAPPRQRNTPPPMPVVKAPDAKAKPADAKVDAKAAKPAAAPPVDAKPVDAKPAKVDAMAATTPLAKVDTKPVTPVEAKKPTAPPAPEAGTSRALVALLVVVVVAAIGFLVYRYAMKSTAKPEPVKPAPAAMKPVPPPPPPVESHKLATTPEQATDVKPTAAGQIETLAKDGPVASGAVIATFAGAKPLQTEVAGLTKDVDTRLPAEIAQAQKDADAATAANNKNQLATAQAKLAERQKSLADRQTKLTAKQADLDKLEIKAPAAGTIAAKSKVGAHVTPNDAVFSLTQPAVRTATFAKADGATAGAQVLLVNKADGSKLACTVTSADPGATAISCPADMTPDGAEVTYGGIDPSPPPPAPTNSGSAAAVTPPPPPSPPPPPPAPHPAATHTQPKAPIHPKAPATGSSTGSSSTDTTTEPAPAPAPAPDTSAGSAQ